VHQTAAAMAVTKSHPPTKTTPSTVIPMPSQKATPFLS